MTKLKGTCQVCGRLFVVRNGRINRHGWRELGGRLLGQYGNARHTGSCYAAGELPLEVSCEVAKEYLTKLLRPGLVRAEQRVVELEGRPPVTTEITRCPRTDAWLRDGGWGTQSGRTMTLLPVDDFEPEYAENDRLTPRSRLLLQHRDAYKSAHGTVTYYAKNWVKTLQAEVGVLEHRVAEWTPDKTWKGAG